MSKDRQVLRDHKGLKVPRVHRDLLVLKDLLGRKAQRGLLAHKDLLGRKVQMDPLAQPARKVLLARKAQTVLRVLKDYKVSLAQRDRWDLRVRQVPMEQMESMGHKAPPDQKGRWVQRDQKGHEDRKVSKVRWVCPEVLSPGGSA